MTNIPAITPGQLKLVLDLATTEGCKLADESIDLVVVVVEAEGPAHAEVADLGVLFTGQKDVTGGQISVNELHRLQVGHAQSHLVHQTGYRPHWQSARNNGIYRVK